MEKVLNVLRKFNVGFYTGILSVILIIVGLALLSADFSLPYYSSSVSSGLIWLGVLSLVLILVYCILPLFKISNDVAREFEDILSGKVQNITTDDIDSSVEIQVKDLIENSFETLKDRINNLSPDEMEELIKEILNAMGYVARRTPKGPDRGVDVTASKDGLGLEDPRIFVEVKHRQSQQGSKEIRAFLGGRKDTDKCIFVSTGGFTIFR